MAKHQQLSCRVCGGKETLRRKTGDAAKVSADAAGGPQVDGPGPEMDHYWFGARTAVQNTHYSLCVRRQPTAANNPGQGTNLCTNKGKLATPPN